jgi:hypothetical protein
MSDASQMGLQLETIPPESASCSICGQPISRSYFTLGAQLACERCKSEWELARRQPLGLRTLRRAIAIGSAWGLLGALVWWGVRVTTDYELGLIAIAIGYFVGRSVSRATGARGGLGYRALAVALTYFWICANYVPDVVQAFGDASETAVGESAEHGAQSEGDVQAPLIAASGVNERTDGAEDMNPLLALALLPVLVFGLAMAAPILAGAENLIGLLIIAFGLYQAWALTAPVVVEAAGPFSLAPTPGPTAPSA